MTKYTRAELDKEARHYARQNGYRYTGWELHLSNDHNPTLVVNIASKVNGPALPYGQPFINVAI